MIKKVPHEANPSEQGLNKLNHSLPQRLVGELLYIQFITLTTNKPNQLLPVRARFNLHLFFTGNVRQIKRLFKHQIPRQTGFGMLIFARVMAAKAFLQIWRFAYKVSIHERTVEYVDGCFHNN